jgi:hypothetical protein
MDTTRMNQGYVSQCSIIDEEPNTNTNTTMILSFERF